MPISLSSIDVSEEAPPTFNGQELLTMVNYSLDGPEKERLVALSNEVRKAAKTSRFPKAVADLKAFYTAHSLEKSAYNDHFLLLATEIHRSF